MLGRKKIHDTLKTRFTVERKQVAAGVVELRYIYIRRG